MDGEKRVASVVAVDSCELFSLSRREFTRAIEPYPDLYFRIRKMAQERLQRTMQQTMTEREDATKRDFSIVNMDFKKNLNASTISRGVPSRDDYTNYQV